MFRLSKPDATSVERFLAGQTSAPFSYPHVGASRAIAPQGYNVDHNRILLGSGPDAFERARLAIREWRMFDLSWARLLPEHAATQPGTEVAEVVSHLGFYSLNACRVAYTVDEQGPLQRFGFAYGTLLDHPVSGEERFSVEFNARDQTVWCDLYAFSCPKRLARLAYPYLRALQKRFARDSKAAMVRAVRAAPH